MTILQLDNPETFDTWIKSIQSSTLDLFSLFNDTHLKYCTHYFPLASKYLRNITRIEYHFQEEYQPFTQSILLTSENNQHNIKTEIPEIDKGKISPNVNTLKNLVCVLSFVNLYNVGRPHVVPDKLKAIESSKPCPTQLSAPIDFVAWIEKSQIIDICAKGSSVQIQNWIQKCKSGSVSESTLLHLVTFVQFGDFTKSNPIDLKRMDFEFYRMDEYLKCFRGLDRWSVNIKDKCIKLEEIGITIKIYVFGEYGDDLENNMVALMLYSKELNTDSSSRENRLAAIEKRVEEIYYAPGNPGYEQAQSSFKETACIKKRKI